MMDPSEVRVFVAQITDQDLENVPEDHPEVEALSGISTDELVDKLCETCDPEMIDKCFDNLASRAVWRRQKAAIRRLFESADVDEDGMLDRDELHGLLNGTQVFRPEVIESLLAEADGKLDVAGFLRLFRQRKNRSTRLGKGYAAVLKAADTIPELHEVTKEEFQSELLGRYEERTLAGGLEEWEELQGAYSEEEPFVDTSWEGKTALISGTGREKQKYLDKCAEMEDWIRVWDLTSEGP